MWSAANVMYSDRYIWVNLARQFKMLLSLGVLLLPLPNTDTDLKWSHNRRNVSGLIQWLNALHSVTTSKRSLLCLLKISYHKSFSHLIKLIYCIHREIQSFILVPASLTIRLPNLPVLLRVCQRKNLLATQESSTMNIRHMGLQTFMSLY